MIPKEVLTGTGLGHRKTKASRLIRRKFSALEADDEIGNDESFIGDSLKVWHIIPLMKNVTSSSLGFD